MWGKKCEIKNEKMSQIKWRKKFSVKDILRNYLVFSYCFGPYRDRIWLYTDMNAAIQIYSWSSFQKVPNFCICEEKQGAKCLLLRHKHEKHKIACNWETPILLPFYFIMTPGINTHLNIVAAYQIMNNFCTLSGMTIHTGHPRWHLIGNPDYVLIMNDSNLFFVNYYMYIMGFT